jgi:hypothetical protein
MSMAGFTAANRLAPIIVWVFRVFFFFFFSFFFSFFLSFSF